MTINQKTGIQHSRLLQEGSHFGHRCHKHIANAHFDGRKRNAATTSARVLANNSFENVFIIVTHLHQGMVYSLALAVCAARKQISLLYTTLSVPDSVYVNSGLKARFDFEIRLDNVLITTLTMTSKFLLIHLNLSKNMSDMLFIAKPFVRFQANNILMPRAFGFRWSAAQLIACFMCCLKRFWQRI